MGSRISKAKWEQIFKEQEESGKTNQEMQDKYNVSNSTYYKYKNRYHKEITSDFIKLEPENSITNNQAKITFPNGLTIEVIW